MALRKIIVFLSPLCFFVSLVLSEEKREDLSLLGKIANIKIEQDPYAILEAFFRKGVEEEQYGYVIEGIKPVSVRQFYSLDSFPISSDVSYSKKEFVYSLLAEKASLIWKELSPLSKIYAVKIASLPYGQEICFIHLPKLREVIQNHLSLFRYALGPTLTVDELVSQIAYSSLPLQTVLKNDRVLEGLVLGFGLHNSLLGGRKENIEVCAFAKDTPPLAPHSSLLPSLRDKTSSWMGRVYGGHYLAHAGGDEGEFKETHLSPSLGFSTLQEECVYLLSLEEPLPPLEKKTGFLFLSYVGSSENRNLYARLKEGQKRSEQLLRKPHLLPKILGKKELLSLSKLVVKEKIDGERLVEKVIHRFPKEKRASFLQAFREPKEEFRIPPSLFGASEALLLGVKQALHNHQQALCYLQKVAKDGTWKEVTPGLLYMKKIESGEGEEIEGDALVQLDYVIRDVKGEILFAERGKRVWIRELIRGLAEGVQGMTVGEKRRLVLSPQVAFGVMTTLPPCLGLEIDVHLRKREKKGEQMLCLPPEIDLSWVKDPKYVEEIEASIHQKVYFTASFYRDLFEKIQEGDIFTLLVK